MAKATHTLKPAVLASKPDPATQARHVWRAAYSQSRRQLRPSPRHTIGARVAWLMDAIRARFGASGYPVAQQAARLAFDRHTLGRGTTGTIVQHQHQGLLDHAGRPTRAATVEPFLGGKIVWAFDPLTDVHGRRADRAYRARQRRATAAAMAADRLDRFAITPSGKAALLAAGVV